MGRERLLGAITTAGRTASSANPLYSQCDPLENPSSHPHNDQKLTR